MIRAPADASGESPSELGSALAEGALEGARLFFERPAQTRRQETFTFDASVFAADAVRGSLFEAYGGKCAYCETPLTWETVVVNQFRPMSGALDLQGVASPDHYWWLAYEWENLYPSCADCQSFKGQRFPVAGRRARVGVTGERLAAEKPLLLDPRRDHPEAHLVFADDGTVASATRQGETTIDVLSLNRGTLVAPRAAALADARKEWNELVARLGSAPPEAAEIEALFSLTRPFAAMRRQFVNTWAQAHRAQIDAVLQKTAKGASTVAEVAADVQLVSQAERRRVKSSFTARQEAQDAYSVNAPSIADDTYFARTRRIERIVLHNFKVIRDLDLVLPRIASTTSGAPWLMLLGENGSGKSSVLQAVALALMGDEARASLKLDASTFVTNGERRGTIEIHLAGATAPVHLGFSRGAPDFTGEAEPKMLLLAYGATRLLPRGRLETPEPGGPVRVANMFDPFSPIGNVTEWLLGFDDKRFDALARALKSVLDLGSEDRLLRNRRAGRIEVEAYGTRVPLEHLSDGYQSVVALATDIMAVLLERWSSVDAAEGTVLIDELGAHLHPRWRMRIIPSLRQVFPRVQFLASTHDPLCLRGLEDGEVAVMRRGPQGEIVALTDLPQVAGLRVDQLLTSEHFGLNSTVDPELDALFTEYYALKGKRKLTSVERRRHDELKARLDDLQVLGSTRRERLVLEAADEYIAREPELTDPGKRVELRQATRSKIADLWAEVNADSAK